MTVWAICRYCQGSGSVVATDKATGSVFGFSCTCSAGARYSALPKWNDRLKTKFLADCDAQFEDPAPPKPKTEPEPF